MEGFVLFLMIVFGILQIILFFKIWGATNDIDKLKSTICDKTHSVDRDKYIRKMYLLNKSNEAEVFLNESYSEEIIAIYSDCIRNCSVENKIWHNGVYVSTSEAFSIRKDELTETYKPFYQLFGLNIPTQFMDINFETLQNIGNDNDYYTISKEDEE